MYVKICPHCSGASYSASRNGKWLCPYCGRDITLQRSRPAGPAGSGYASEVNRAVKQLTHFHNMPKNII